jgi:fructose-1,6-bisphosphatase/inositol monophosphatase family enzyme
MVSVLEFEAQFIKIIDTSISGQCNSFVKDDFSLVTDSDIMAERELIKYIEDNFPNISIISEENPSSHSESYLLNSRFAIIDPIDGTENYHYTKSNFGSVVSVVYDEFVYHGIYIPSCKQIISSININNYCFNFSSIVLLSTSCLGFELSKIEGSFQNYRIFGSSSYMFFLLLKGDACSYLYCGNSKLWDYYTGICLALMIKQEFDILLNNEYINEIDLGKLELSHKSTFSIIRKQKNI